MERTCGRFAVYPKAKPDDLAAFRLGLIELQEGRAEAAAALAADHGRLRTLRRSLRDTMRRSPLMDAARFAHHLEHAYRCAWRTHCSAAPSMMA
jgi:hypothetical protein